MVIPCRWVVVIVCPIHDILDEVHTAHSINLLPTVLSGGLRRFGRGLAVNVLTIGSSMFLSACVLPMGSPSLDWRIHKDGSSQDRENAILILAVVVGADKEHAQGSLATWHAVLVLSETYIRCTLTCSFVQGPAPTLGVTPGGTPTSILDIWSSNFQDASLTNGTSTGCAQNARSASRTLR